jgi:hypothetical protein
MGAVKMHEAFRLGNLSRRDHVGNPGVHGRIILI